MLAFHCKLSSFVDSCYGPKSFRALADRLVGVRQRVGFRVQGRTVGLALLWLGLIGNRYHRSYRSLSAYHLEEINRK